MIFLGFAVFLLFLSALPFAGAVCLKRRPERLFAAGLLLNGLVFYFACAVGLCGAGFYAILAGNLALYVPALLRVRKEPGAIRDFRTPGVKAFYLMLALGFLTAMREHLLWWDEFSHWGFSAKLLFETGRMTCEQGDLVEHASYPPGLPVLDVLVHKCFFGAGFRDFIPRFAVRTAKICIFILPFGDVPGRRASFRDCLAGMLFFWLLTCLMFPDGNFSCESDCILGLVFVAAVYAVMRHDRSVADDLFLALLLAWLFLIKKAGMGFAVMTQLLYVVRWIADRRSGGTPKRPVWSLLVVLAAPFAMQATWSLLLKIHHTPIIFPVGKISPAGIWRLVRYGEPDYWRDIAGLFGKQLLRRLPVFLAAVGGLVWYRLAAGNRPRRDGDLVWFLPLTAVMFLVTLFLTYMFIFSSFQAYLMVSFRRYVHGFMIMPLGVLLMLTFSGGWGDKARKILTSYLVLVPVAVLIERLYVAEERSTGWFSRNWPKDSALIDARYGRLLRAPGKKFVIISGVNGGMYYYMFRYEFEDRFAAELLLDDPESGRAKPATIREFVRQAPYVLVVYPQEDLAREYAELWETTPPEPGAPFTLFEVTPEGRLRPVR